MHIPNPLPRTIHHLWLLCQTRPCRKKMLKKANMKILVKKTKMLRRMTRAPDESGSEMKREQLPAHKEAAKSFERNNKEIQKKKNKSQPSTRQKDCKNKETTKGPLSDCRNSLPSI